MTALTLSQKKAYAKQFHLSYPATANVSEYGYFDETLSPAIDAMQERANRGQLKRCLIISDHPNVTHICPYRFTVIKTTGVHKLDVSQKWDGVIVDFAHYLANPKTRRSRCTYALGDQAHYRIALTTIPLLNRAYDLFGLMRFVEPSIFGKDFKQFKANYPYNDMEEQLLVVDQLYRAMKPIVWRGANVDQ